MAKRASLPLKITKYGLCLLLTGSQIFSSFLAVTAKEPDPSGFITDTYTYSPVLYATADSSDQCEYVYTDAYFDSPSQEINQHLATMSVSLAYSSSSALNTDDYAHQSKNLTALLSDIGFQDVEVNDDYQKKPTVDSVGVAAGQKQIETSDGTYTLLAFVPHSAGYESEWVSNVTLGESGNAEGFDTSAKKMLAYASQYIKAHSITGNVKIWLAGYSRGGAICNIAGALLDDDPDYLGIHVTADNIYDYSYAVPMTTDKDEATAASYTNIFNYIFDNDVVTMIPFAELGFRRFGRDITISVTTDQKEKMLALLKKSGNTTLYDNYTSETDSIDPLSFHEKKLDTGKGAIEDSTKQLFAQNSKDFLTQRFQYLCKHLVVDRKTYVEQYQPILQMVLKFYYSLTPDQTAALKEAFSDQDELKDDATLLIGYITFYHLFEVQGEPAAQNMKKMVIQCFTEKFIDKAFNALKITDDDPTRKAFTDSATLGKVLDLADCLLLCYEGQEKGNLLEDPLSLGATVIGNASRFITPHIAEIGLAWMRCSDSYYTADGLCLPILIKVNSASMTNGMLDTSDAQGGSVTGGGIIDVGGSVSLHATPYTGYNFIKWVCVDPLTGKSTDMETTLDVTLTDLKQAENYYAVFEKIPEPTPSPSPTVTPVDNCDAVATGDTTHPYAWGIVCFVATLLSAYLIYRKKKYEY